MKAPGFNPILARVTILARYFPCTNTLPNRYLISVRGYPTRSYCADTPDVDYPYVAQYCAERYIRENGLPWFIASAGMLPDGDHVFIVKGKDESN